MRVPVLLLTGFLGSGKTTLLNGLLRVRPAGDTGKLAVIVNEFGDVGIDASLLPPGVTRQVELPGGCICCALDEDLKKTLDGLLTAEPALSRVLIETTGIAEPLPISWTLASPELEARVRLEAVVTVVDAVEHMNSRAHSPSVLEQVRYADVLVLTKLDLLGAAPTELLAQLLRDNPGAPVVAKPRTELAAALWRVIRDPGGELAGVRTGGPVGRELGEHAHGAHGHGGHGEPGEPGERVHGLAAVSTAAPDVYDLEELMAAVEALPPAYVRIKGIVRAVDGTTGSDDVVTVAFHRVGARFSYETLSRVAATRVVAIGTAVAAHELDAVLSRARRADSDT